MEEKLRKLYLATKNLAIPVADTIVSVWKIFLNVLCNIKKYDQKLMENLAQNSHIFIARCFTIGVDSLFACTIMSVILSLFNLVKWHMSLIISIGTGIICGAIIFGFVTDVAITAYIFIPVGKYVQKDKATSKFTKNMEENAYEIVEKVCTITKIVSTVALGAVLCTIIGLIAWQKLAIMLIVTAIALFATSGLYLFIKCIIKGIIPNKEAADELFDELEMKISSKGA